MKYLFYIPVGDWSNDGHEKCKYYLVESNKPVEEVREAHFKIHKETGFDIDNFCREYGDDFFGPEEYELLIKLGFKFDTKNFNWAEDEDGGAVYPSGFAKIWIHLLMYVDKDLELKMLDIPNLSFYGFDEFGRHIHANGYGCFSLY